MEYKDNYLPVDPDFVDEVVKLSHRKTSGKVHYFDPENQIQLKEGIVGGIVKNGFELFVNIKDQGNVRLDKVITLFGRPGPSYALYDSYANACLACEQPN